MLPSNGSDWPPRDLAAINKRMAQWSAWYVGNVEGLLRVYSGQDGRVQNKPAQFRGGIVGWAARSWYGAPVIDATAEPKIRIHVPLPADLAQASSDLLFADPPTITGATPADNIRISEYLDDGLVGVLAGGHEIGAAMGGAYYKIDYDTQLQQRVFISAVDPDAAVPCFYWGRLRSVIFHWNLTPLTQGNTDIWRHLEEHSMVNGIGVVEHALYQGSLTDIGVRKPLNYRPETEMLAQFVDGNSQISTQTPGLDVVYIPNLRPQREWRTDPQGSHLGRPDYAGVEPLFDALDRTMSSWMRDVDLGKGRILMPDFMLNDNGPGQGQSMDLDREIFHGYPAGLADAQSPQVVQFLIRVAEHKETVQELTENILRSTGYSSQTFGEDESGGASTATEVMSRDRRTSMTRDRKMRLHIGEIKALVSKMLAMDAALFNAGTSPDDVEVVFSDSAQDTPLQLAKAAQALHEAGAASTRTLVQLVHPDWEEEQIAGEVALIHGENSITMADPTTLGQGGVGLSDLVPPEPNAIVPVVPHIPIVPKIL